MTEYLSVWLEAWPAWLLLWAMAATGWAIAADHAYRSERAHAQRMLKLIKEQGCTNDALSMWIREHHGRCCCTASARRVEREIERRPVWVGVKNMEHVEDWN